MFKPSIQQQAVINWIVKGIGSCVVKAVPGAGKTALITNAVQYMKGTVILCAYNKKISVEIEQKIPKNLPNVTVSTMHAAGLKIWKKVNPKVQVDANKCRNIFRELIDEKCAPFEGSVLSLVNYAKQKALGVDSSIDDNNIWSELVEHFSVEMFDEEKLLIDMAKQVYKKSIDMDHKVIDFEDMILAPLIHNCKFPEYDFVVVDEAADLNTSRRLLAIKMMGKTGRLIAVGDPSQAINSWCGADSDSLDIIKEMTNAIDLPLSVSFRCPQLVVKEAQKYFSHIQAHESAPLGNVSTLAKDRNIVFEAKAGDAILCRFNAPLMKLVYKFIGEGKAAKIEGRDIGSALKTLAKRWKVKSFSLFLDKLNTYKEKECTKLRLKEKEAAAVAIEDKVECLKVLVDRVERIDTNVKDPIYRLCQEIDNIFDDNVNSNYVILSSIHRSKGREFPSVFWLQTGANKRAKKDWEILAEENLAYVAITRAKENLIYFSLDK